MSAALDKEKKLKQKTDKKTKEAQNKSKELTDKEKEERDKVIDNLLERTRTLVDGEESTKAQVTIIQCLLHNACKCIHLKSQMLG